MEAVLQEEFLTLAFQYAIYREELLKIKYKDYLSKGVEEDLKLTLDAFQEIAQTHIDRIKNKMIQLMLER